MNTDRGFVYTSKEPLNRPNNLQQSQYQFDMKNALMKKSFFLVEIVEALSKYRRDLFMFVWCTACRFNYKTGSALIVPFRWINFKKLIHLSNILRPSKKDDTFSVVLCWIYWPNSSHFYIECANNKHFSLATRESIQYSVKIHQSFFWG